MQVEILTEILQKLTEIKDCPHYMEFNTRIIEERLNELVAVNQLQLDVMKKLLKIAEMGVKDKV